MVGRTREGRSEVERSQSESEKSERVAEDAREQDETDLSNVGIAGAQNKEKKKGKQVA